MTAMLTRTAKSPDAAQSPRSNAAPAKRLLYDGSGTRPDIPTEVTFEDGRKGVIAARVKIRDNADPPRHRRSRRHGGGRMSVDQTSARNCRQGRPRNPRARPSNRRAPGVMNRQRPAPAPRHFEESPACRRQCLAGFRWREGPDRRLLDIRKARYGPSSGPTGRQDLDAQLHQRVLSSHRGLGSPFVARRGARCAPYEAAAGGIARTFQNVALFKGMSTLDNIMAGRSLKIEGEPVLADPALRPGHARGSRASPCSRGHHRLPCRNPGDPQDACRKAAPTDCKSAWSWAVRWPWSPICCFSTSPWRA